ncbi:MAG: allophanate hydrolase [Pegethrix bostrychoides GSE-TBD4-15B]|jgi:allophanate hydrolase|uniref:Allophanate hydrolase n=1 Tax=Pegethrix bostrychoides GSE-TBD4-15B TaxID=2839662 RepID=A0A951U490_9CYAN|nr:allophanate hydrolase [Pegethrix bostrychoides GSE-TBD4-15B]
MANLHQQDLTQQGSHQQSLDLRALRQRYRDGETPESVIAQIYEQIAAYGDPAIWIYLAPLADSLQRARALQQQDLSLLPLYGVPFAIKDNIDWEASPTTAGCPAFAYQPTASATVVQKLCAAGAIPIGKTNLDQFATGLVGTRSPYGICRNPFDARFIPGGSSSGSGVAVAAGLVSFALGTDTAGSGRVPAAFGNIVGLKPTKGQISTKGLVPAVRSLDCISIFALTCADAATVLQVAGGFDPEDAFSRAALPLTLPDLTALRVGVPDSQHLKFFENAAAEQNYQAALERLWHLGCQPVPIDFRPFAETVPLLYQGAWVAERLAAVGDFLAQQPEAIDPTVRQIIADGSQYDAVAAYRSFYQLAELKRQAELQWAQMDVLALPTTGTIYSLAAVEAEPLKLNSNLGTYTNFVNLLDLAAIAVPNGFQPDGLPTGLSLIAPAWTDQALCRLGAAYHAAVGGLLGATTVPLPPLELPELPELAGLPTCIEPSQPDWIKIAVVGAHLSGQPLNPQLTNEQGRLVRACRTQPIYRLYALAGGAVPKPGLVRMNGQGYAVELEVWELPAAGFGRFVNNIPSPLGIGTIILEDGEVVKGFLCEPFALEAAPDISQFGGWRAYLASL